MTFNLKDFPQETLARFDIEAVHPDEFLGDLFAVTPGGVCGAVKLQRESLRNPAKSVEELLTILESQGLPLTVARLRQFAGLL